MVTKQADLISKLKSSESSVDLIALRKYGDLTDADVKDLVIRSKWFQAFEITLDKEFQTALSILIGRIKEVVGRYDETLVEVKLRVQSLELVIEKHLEYFLK